MCQYCNKESDFIGQIKKTVFKTDIISVEEKHDT